MADKNEVLNVPQWKTWFENTDGTPRVRYMTLVNNDNGSEVLATELRLTRQVGIEHRLEVESWNLDIQLNMDHLDIDVKKTMPVPMPSGTAADWNTMQRTAMDLACQWLEGMTSLSVAAQTRIIAAKVAYGDPA